MRTDAMNEALVALGAAGCFGAARIALRAACALPPAAPAR